MLVLGFTIPWSSFPLTSKIALAASCSKFDVRLNLEKITKEIL